MTKTVIVSILTLLITKNAFGVHDTYLVNGNLETCPKGRSGYEYTLVNNVIVEEEEGFICAESPYHVQQDIYEAYNRYGIEIESLIIEVAVPMGEEKNKGVAASEKTDIRI